MKHVEVLNWKILYTYNGLLYSFYPLLEEGECCVYNVLSLLLIYVQYNSLWRDEGASYISVSFEKRGVIDAQQSGPRIIPSPQNNPSSCPLCSQFPTHTHTYH